METNGNQIRGLDEESRQMVIETVRQLRSRMLTKEKILELDKQEIFPEQIIRQMLGPEIGLQLLFIPEEYGGMGGGARDCCAVTREMARICLGIGTAFFAIQLGADPILVGGTDEQKAKWLGAIAEGGALVAYAVTEPGAGSNLAALKTKADPVTDQSGKVVGYKLNGSKQFISNGGYADIITVLAKAPEGLTFFVVEKGMEGLTQHKGEEKHGIRASNTAPITLDDVFVPLENLLGAVPGKGLKQSNKVFGYTRLMVASMALGAGEAALDIVIPYAQERIQFGSALSQKQGYTHKLVVPHAVRLTAAAAYIEQVALELDSCDDDLQVEGSIGKLFATEAANRCADDAMQALGGYGYITEYEVEKIKRDVKITCIYEGTSEIQQNIISTFRWKKTRKSKGRFYLDMAEQMEALEQNSSQVGAGALALAARGLNFTINMAHENRWTRQQTVMFSLADMMTHVEVGVSLARKAAGADDADYTRACSRLFAGEVAGLVASRGLDILLGMGADGQQVEAWKADVDYSGLLNGRRGWIADMDKVADILFERC